MKKAICLIATLCTSMVYASNINESVPTTTNTSTRPAVIGGWSPMFFSNYNNSQVSEIISMIKANQIKNIKISYPTAKQDLALKIVKNIQKQTNIAITLEKLDIPDTSTTKYNHDQVVVTLYYGTKE